MRRISVFTMRVPDIDKLEWIKKGNELPNFDKFMEEVFRKESVDDVFELWKYARQLQGKPGLTTYENERFWFNHELGTLLISCKELRESFSHGMRYGNLCVTTYQNNSIPNLFEFGVTFGMYDTNPLDLIHGERP